VLLAGLAPLAQAQASAGGFVLPEGPGKETVGASCGGCHAIERLGAGYTAEGWKTVMRMMRNFGAPIPADQFDTITAYLTRSFPERERPAAVLIDGPAKGSFRMWPAVTPGSRPHDPWVSRDGAIWYTAQLNNALGRVDPRTGQSREYPMKSPQTAPHGLVEDAGGNIWFTGNFRGLIGKLDPRSGEVTEYPLPDPSVRDPHTLVFDAQGILWFTAQVGNRMGRLDPKTGEIRLISPSAPGSRPYGVQIDSKGVPFVVLFGTNKVARIDPKTLAVTEYRLPEGARPRRLAIDAQDRIWYTDFARGYLGLLDPVSGQVREWLSPSGPKAAPYGIVFTRGALWYSESYAKPNTLVRFDPAAERFQTWAIPGGGDIVRNMAVAPDGAPAMAHSLTNQVSRFDIAP
jgi:virginiamycin B lyase